MNFTVEQIEEIVHKSPKANGAYNYFVKLNDKVGIKYCCSESQRDRKLFLQSQAAIIGLGPNVYGKINITVKDVLYYGYLTEIVKVYNKKQLEDMSDKEYFYIQSLTLKLKEELLEKIGFKFSDNHLGNIGYKNEEMVCIDFDEIENNLDHLDEEFENYL